jgi:hypothetical protein
MQEINPDVTRIGVRPQDGTIHPAPDRQIQNKMLTSYFSKYLFWSYRQNTDLPEEIVIKRVLAFGEMADLMALNKLIAESKIQEVLKNWKEKDKYRKRIHFYNKVINQV